MTPFLYTEVEPREAPVDPDRCEWAVRGWPDRRGEVRQCSRKVRERIAGHGFCHPHGKLVRPDGEH